MLSKFIAAEHSRCDLSFMWKTVEYKQFDYNCCYYPLPSPLLLSTQTHTVEGLAQIYKDPEFRKKIRSMAREHRGK